MTYKVFIDGREGTTGLQLEQRLSGRDDITLLQIEADLRKDTLRREQLINEAEVVFLCLPDEAALEAVALCHSPRTILIDASTAHRVSKDWTYGLPELSPNHRQAIARSKRIANPGCYATGANCILYPLTTLNILPLDYPVTIHAVSGYSGGGKKLIAAYESANRPPGYLYPCQYALGLAHKHLPEMQNISGLLRPPIFNPLVCDFYAGMEVSIPLYADLLKGKPGKKAVLEVLTEYYAGQRFVTVAEQAEEGRISAGEHIGDNYLTLYVCGNDRQMTLVSVLDNLGKGASGAAVQNMNIALGLDESVSLD